MKVEGIHFRTIWENPDGSGRIQIIDQRHLPFKFIIEDIENHFQVFDAIRDMHVRGAPLIGIAAAYGVYFAAKNAPKDDSFDDFINKAVELIKSSRPTAVNLFYSIERTLQAISSYSNFSDKINAALMNARLIVDDDIKICKSIGIHGLKIIEEISSAKNGESVNIMTHCNAGWLATVNYGTATAPIYLAYEKGIKVQIWVSETRPRNQGSRLTAWELGQEGIPHTIIVDNEAGYLMQKGMIDLVIVGTDRTLLSGDVVNKTGTYLKALAAFDNDVPFYVALPSSSIDWNDKATIDYILIEERSPDEIKYVEGVNNNSIVKVLTTPISSPALNYAFDITPSHLITGLITEKGICKASKKSILNLFPEKR